ncbi:MAG: NIPSNAP family protein [Pseudomonadota bacterium]
MTINQLRIYEIPPGNRGPFLDRFRDHAARLMADHGFRICAMWTSDPDGRVRFVYLLSWTDEAEMRAAWEAFMADPDWARIKAETSAIHGDFVLGIEDIPLIPVPFSAAIEPAP